MGIKQKNIISEEEQRPKKHHFWPKILLDEDGEATTIKGYILLVSIGILVILINPYLPCHKNPLLASTCYYIKEKIWL